MEIKTHYFTKENLLNNEECKLCLQTLISVINISLKSGGNFSQNRFN